MGMQDFIKGFDQIQIYIDSGLTRVSEFEDPVEKIQVDNKNLK